MGSRPWTSKHSLSYKSRPWQVQVRCQRVTGNCLQEGCQGRVFEEGTFEWRPEGSGALLKISSLHHKLLWVQCWPFHFVPKPAPEADKAFAAAPPCGAVIFIRWMMGIFSLHKVSRCQTFKISGLAFYWAQMCLPLTSTHQNEFFFPWTEIVRCSLKSSFSPSSTVPALHFPTPSQLGVDTHTWVIPEEIWQEHVPAWSMQRSGINALYPSHSPCQLNTEDNESLGTTATIWKKFWAPEWPRKREKPMDLLTFPELSTWARNRLHWGNTCSGLILQQQV